MVALERADDAHGDGFAHAERIADGEYDITDAGLVGVGKSDRRQFSRQLDLDYGQIGFRVRADDVRAGFATIRQSHLDLIGGLDDMLVGEDVTIGTHDHARTETGIALRFGIALIVEKELETRIVFERVDRSFHFRAGENIDHCRHGFLRRTVQAHPGWFCFVQSRRTFIQSDDPVARGGRQQFGFERVDDEQQRECYRDGLGE